MIGWRPTSPARAVCSAVKPKRAIGEAKRSSRDAIAAKRSKQQRRDEFAKQIARKMRAKSRTEE